ETSLREIFQIGFSLTLELKHRVDRLRKQYGKLELLLSDVRAVVAAIDRRRPMRAIKVEGAEPMPFRSRRELAEASAVLDRAEAQLKIFSAFNFGPSWNADVAFAAIAVTAALDRVAEPRPLPPEKLPELCARLFEGDGAQAARARAFEAISAKVPGAD